MIIMKRTTFLAFALLLPGPLVGQQDQSRVTTTGQGSINLAPTHASVTINVATRAKTASEAAQANDARLITVVNAFKNSDGLIDSVAIGSITVSANENFQERQIVDYEASAEVTAVVRELHRLGEVFDLALANGATGVGRVSFGSDSAGPARRLALRAAFDAAKADAEALAEASGRELGRLLEISTGQPASVRFNSLEEASVSFDYAKSGIVTVGPDPSSVIIGASVVATWAIGR